MRTVYFDQTRKLDPEVTLRRALAPDSDSVIYQDRVIHVAAWAARFLFSSEQLNQPVGRLSGGERARVLIARLMLEPADLLLLDEPTNDLDIPTLEILEENLLDFAGALVLVTHDRYLLDRVATVVLGLDGKGGVERFADYSQWEAWIAERKQTKPKPAPVAAKPAQSPAKKKLSYLDTLEHEGDCPAHRRCRSGAEIEVPPRLKIPTWSAMAVWWKPRIGKWKKRKESWMLCTRDGRNWKTKSVRRRRLLNNHRRSDHDDRAGRLRSSPRHFVCPD